MFFGEQQAPQRIPKTTSFDITFLRHQQGSKAYEEFAALNRVQQKQWIQERPTEGRTIDNGERNASDAVEFRKPHTPSYLLIMR